MRLAYRFCGARLTHGAFTLMELLVVLAIISILASLILGSITVVKRKAVKMQCSNNLRQLDGALNQFVSQYHTYPLMHNSRFLRENAYPEHFQSWKSALSVEALGGDPQRVFQADYDLGIWHCARAQRPKDWTPSHRSHEYYGYNDRGMGTLLNSYGIGGILQTDGFTFSPISENEVKSPGTMMAIGDGLRGWNDIIEDGSGLLWRTLTAEDLCDSSKRSRRRHDNMANVVFCDGHTESIGLTLLFKDQSEPMLKRWNRDALPHFELLR